MGKKDRIFKERIDKSLETIVRNAWNAAIDNAIVVVKRNVTLDTANDLITKLRNLKQYG
jgi:hypothetical protein